MSGELTPKSMGTQQAPPPPPQPPAPKYKTPIQEPPSGFNAPPPPPENYYPPPPPNAYDNPDYQPPPPGQGQTYDPSEIPPPPPNVVMDLPPPMQGAAVCKKERLSAHSTNGSCAGCHHLMDPVGFGLERFDSTGKFRTAEPAFPQCSIDGQGELAGVGSFNGPAELASLMISSGALEPCVVKQVFRFAYGRTEQDEDEGWLAAVERSFTSSGRRFDELLVAMTTDEQFSKRRVEVTP